MFNNFKLQIFNCSQMTKKTYETSGNPVYKYVFLKQSRCFGTTLCVLGSDNIKMDIIKICNM